MPNHVVIASGAVVAVSVAVATAVAIYESPEVRRYADDVRRRIAVALHAMGENISPAHREPLFNRPEDADGFLESRGGASAEAGVDADEETRRRQREELLYWNSVRLEKEKEKESEKGHLEQSENEKAPFLENRTRGSSFDDFLRPDENAEQGTFVFNTGTDTHANNEGLRHRGDGSRGFSSIYANPFADENLISSEELDDAATNTLSPPNDEISDIYSASTRDDEKAPLTPKTAPALTHVESAQSESASTATLDRELGPDEFMTAGQEDRHEAYASIQAWAENSSHDFYSPLPVTPTAPVSEPEVISEGQLTPTDSISVIGSIDDISNDVQSSQDGDTGRYYDVMSESSGMATPASWSEVGSVISESDAPIPVRS